MLLQAPRVKDIVETVIGHPQRLQRRNPTKEKDISHHTIQVSAKLRQYGQLEYSPASYDEG